MHLIYLQNSMILTPLTNSKQHNILVDYLDYRGIHADVIVYTFAHLHTALRTEENLLGVY